MSASWGGLQTCPLCSDSLGTAWSVWVRSQVFRLREKGFLELVIFYFILGEVPQFCCDLVDYMSEAAETLRDYLEQILCAVWN